MPFIREESSTGYPVRETSTTAPSRQGRRPKSSSWRRPRPPVSHARRLARPVQQNSRQPSESRLRLPRTASSRWLWVTGAAFGLAAIATITFVVLHAKGIPASPSTTPDAVIYLGWRIGTVGLLFGASIWCGRHYRAHRHNHEVNQHREACLENMQAFQRAVDDQAVKDMVVLEFSRAAAQGMPTGFISGKAEARADLSPQVLSLATRQASSLGSRSPT